MLVVTKVSLTTKLSPKYSKSSSKLLHRFTSEFSCSMLRGNLLWGVESFVVLVLPVPQTSLVVEEVGVGSRLLRDSRSIWISLQRSDLSVWSCSVIFTFDCKWSFILLDYHYIIIYLLLYYLPITILYHFSLEVYLVTSKYIYRIRNTLLIYYY